MSVVGGIDGNGRQSDPLVIYLACPYSHPNVAVRASRQSVAAGVARRLIDWGNVVYSPLSHFDSDALLRVAADRARWHGLRMLERCDAVLVLRLPGWSQSVGVHGEVMLAEELGKPVSHLSDVDSDAALERALGELGDLRWQ